VVPLVQPDGEAAAPLGRVDQGACAAGEILLASAGEHRVGLVQGAAPRAERQPAGALLGGAELGGAVPHGDPGRPEFAESEVVAPFLDGSG
jgi:hypothetical protein